MDERTSPLTLLLGSVVSGLVAAVAGPALMFALAADSITRRDIDSAHDAIGVAILMGLLFCAIGILIAIFIGFPILLALRRVHRLSLSWAAAAGAGSGVLIAAFFWIFDGKEPTVLLVGLLLGALCGWCALAVAYLLSWRPNRSLERSREG